MQSEAGPNGSLHLLLVIIEFMGFCQDLMCGITLRHVKPCCPMDTDVVALEKRQYSVSVCYRVPLLLSAGVAMLHDRLGQRLRSDIPLRGVSLTFIDQMNPLAHCHYCSLQ